MQIIAPKRIPSTVKERARELAELEYHYNIGNISIGEYLRMGTQIRYGRK